MALKENVICLLFFFFVDIKTFEISAYNENRIFKKNVNNRRNQTTDFSLTSANKPQSSLVLHLQV